MPLSADTRSRAKYRLPDGRMINAIVQRGADIAPMISIEVHADDALWATAQSVAHGTRRIVWAQLAEGM